MFNSRCLIQTREESRTVLFSSGMSQCLSLLIGTNREVGNTARKKGWFRIWESFTRSIVYHLGRWPHNWIHIQQSITQIEQIVLFSTIDSIRDCIRFIRKEYTRTLWQHFLDTPHFRFGNHIVMSFIQWITQLYAFKWVWTMAGMTPHFVRISFIMSLYLLKRCYNETSLSPEKGVRPSSIAANKTPSAQISAAVVYGWMSRRISGDRKATA